MRITLKTIAEAAQVSVSTASRALNDDPAIHASISEESRQRVRDAAQRFQYPVTRPARRGRTNGSAASLEGKTIAIVSLGMDRQLLSLPAVATAINGAEAELAGCGARVMLAHVPDLDEEPRGLAGSGLDGVVLAGSSQGTRIGACQSRFVAGLRQLPTVWLLARPNGCWGMAVGSNDYLTGQRVAEYLIDRGHRRLAYLNPKPEHVVFQRREDGFVSFARRRGVDVQSFSEAPPGGWPLPDSPALGTSAVESLVERILATNPRPTGVFAAADSVAVAVYRSLAARGLTVGKDLSLISANHDQSLTAGLYPHLTTFDIHAEQIGRMAVRQLAQRLSQGSAGPETELLLEATLLERESVSTIGSREKAGRAGTREDAAGH